MKENKENFIANCKTGNRDAQAWLYQTYAPVLLGVCSRYFQDKEKAEDAMHESMIIIFSKITQYRNEGSFEGWLKRITINKCIEIIRKEKWFSEIDNLQNEPIETEEEILSTKDKILNSGLSQTDILNALQELPDGFRTVFNLYAIEGLKHKEIAQMLGISEGTSKSQLNRAREKLQKLLISKCEAQTKEKEERVTILAGLFIMNNDSHSYLDQWMKSSLESIQVTPANVRPLEEMIPNVASQAQTGFLNRLFNNWSGLHTIITASISSILVVGIFVMANLPEKEIKENLPVAPLKSDAVENEIGVTDKNIVTHSDSQPVQNTNNEQIVPAKKNIVIDSVQIKKRKTIKTKKIIQDTVHQRKVRKVYR